jgi:hypothetical protein
VSLELNYDAIFLPGFYDKVGLIVPQLVFYSIDTATLLGTGGWNSPELTKMTGKHMRKGYFVREDSSDRKGESGTGITLVQLFLKI